MMPVAIERSKMAKSWTNKFEKGGKGSGIAEVEQKHKGKKHIGVEEHLLSSLPVERKYR